MAKKIHIVLINKPFRSTPLTAQGCTTVGCGPQGDVFDGCSNIDNGSCAASGGGHAYDSCGSAIDSTGCCAYGANSYADDSCEQCDYGSCWTTTPGDSVSDYCTGQLDNCDFNG